MPTASSTKPSFAAYGWSPDLTNQQILANLLALNHQRAAANLPDRRFKSPET